MILDSSTSLFVIPHCLQLCKAPPRDRSLIGHCQLPGDHRTNPCQCSRLCGTRLSFTPCAYYYLRWIIVDFRNLHPRTSVTSSCCSVCCSASLSYRSYAPYKLLNSRNYSIYLSSCSIKLRHIDVSVISPTRISCSPGSPCWFRSSVFLLFNVRSAVQCTRRNSKTSCTISGVSSGTLWPESTRIRGVVTLWPIGSTISTTAILLCRCSAHTRRFMCLVFCSKYS